MSSIRLDLLDKKRKAVFERLGAFKKEAVLGGGTALSLQIGHRYSFDFDLFLDRSIERKDFLKIKELFEIKRIGLNTSQQLTVTVSDDIGITLLYYPYKRLFGEIITASLPIFSIKDIAADKAFTIGRRASWRDYVDLFFIIKEGHIGISELLKICKRKFDVEFEAKLFLEQLVYFEDLETAKISFVEKEYPASEIQNFLKLAVKKFRKSII